MSTGGILPKEGMRVRTWGTFFIILAGLCIAGKGFGQALTPKDTTIILLENVYVQAECNKALDDLYNFNFEEAERQFQYLRIKYRWHPLPYFLMGLIEWWKIMPNTKDTSHDDTFLAYMDSAILVAENLYKNQPSYKIEASFFLAAAYGFKGRLYSEEDRQNWRKAAVAGNSALGYLEESRGYHNLSPELLFGDALFNYFSVWVRENYPALRPILWLFPKGDKELGLKQLTEVAGNAFYTRIEAMVWLMRILNSYENNQPRALQLSEYLHELYPNNPYFHRYYARMLYYTRQYAIAEPVCKAILERIDSGWSGYEANSGRYAAFFLGEIAKAKQDYRSAKHYYERCVIFARQTDEVQSGYYLYSLVNLGEIAEREGRKSDAKAYYTEVRKRSSRSDAVFKEARSRMRKIDNND